MNRVDKIINPVVIIDVDEVDIDVAVKVQIGIVADVIQEAIDRIEIERIKAENPAPVDDPAIA